MSAHKPLEGVKVVELASYVAAPTAGRMMAEIKGLIDDNGVINECNKILKEEYKSKLVEMLAELEDNECLKFQSFS